jgi:hypothetical protein
MSSTQLSNYPVILISMLIAFVQIDLNVKPLESDDVLSMALSQNVVCFRAEIISHLFLRVYFFGSSSMLVVFHNFTYPLQCPTLKTSDSIRLYCGLVLCIVLFRHCYCFRK